MTRHTALLRALAHNIPAHFLERVIQVLPQVYAEAYARTYKDPLFGPDSPEAHDLIGQERHYIFQAKLHEIASECKLGSVGHTQPARHGKLPNNTGRAVRSDSFVSPVAERPSTVRAISQEARGSQQPAGPEGFGVYAAG